MFHFGGPDSPAEIYFTKVEDIGSFKATNEKLGP